MDEKKLLESFAKALGASAQSKLEEIEQKKIQQEKMLKGMAKLLGTDSLLSEMEEKEAQDKRAIEEKKERERKLLEDLNASLLRLVDNHPEKVDIIEQEISETVAQVVEEQQPIETVMETVAEAESEPVVEDLQDLPQLPADDIITQTVVNLSKIPQKSIQQAADAIPDSFRKELDILKKSIADLHRFATRHSQMGGGGEVNLRYLDDVNANTIADGLYLRYDGPTRKFVFDTPSGGGGYTLPTASTTILGGVKIDGNTIVIAANGVISANISSGGGGPYSYLISADSTRVANLDNSGVLSIPGNIIPQANLVYSLGNTTNRFDSMWVGSNSITFTDLNSSFPDQKLSLSNGVFYIAIANSTAQSNAGFRVGNFLLQNNYIALTNSSAEFFIGTEPATGNLVINRPIVVYAVGTNNTPTFTVSRSGEVQIFTANIQANKQSLSIIGSSDGSTQSVGLAGRMIHVTGNDGSPSRIENDAFGTGAFASYIGRSGRGTANTPSATQNTDTIARFAALGWGTTNFLATNVGSGPPINSIDFVATENYTDSNAGSKLVIYTSPNGSRVRTLSLTVDSTGITANNATLYSITANGSLGTSGQVLTTNGSSVFWGTASGGANGANGVGITNAAVNANGYLIITYSNTATANAGYVVGSNGATGNTGPAGANGISITNTAINANGDLIITYSNTSTANAGHVIPTYSVSYGNSINGGNLALSGNTFTFYPANLTPYATNSYVNSTFVTNTVYQNNHYLSNLYDVSITGAQNNQVLTYSSAISKWINQNITTNTYTTGYYGSFYYSGANVDLSNTAAVYTVPLTGSQGASGISLGTNNNIVFAYAGTYELVYSIQYENNNNQDDAVDVWIRKNGTDLTDTNSIFYVNRKNTGSINGELIAVTPFQVTVSAGDSIQVMTTTSTGQTTIVTIPAQTNPAVPRTPAVIVNVSQVASIVIPNDIAGSSNNASYLGGYAANQYAYANSLSAYQTTAGLSANVATLAANSATYLNGNTASDLRTYASNLASNAYSNAISYSGNAALAYSNAIAYAASNASVYSTFAQNTAIYAYAAANSYVNSTFATNTYVNSTFAPKASPTFSGTLNANDVVITGNLTVTGTTVSVNATTLDVKDLNVTVAKGSTAAGSDGAGITVDGSNAQFYYNYAANSWLINRSIVPDANLTYDLGSPTNRWRSLYISGNTIVIGTANLSSSGSAIALPTGSTVNGVNLEGFAVNTTVFSTFAQNTAIYAYAASNTYLNGNFQTTAGLSANVATLSSNNSSYLGGTAAASFIQNTDSRTLSGNLYFTGANIFHSTSMYVGSNNFINVTHHVISSNSTTNTVITANQITLNGSNVVTTATAMKVYYANGTQAFP